VLYIKVIRCVYCGEPFPCVRTLANLCETNKAISQQTNLRYDTIRYDTIRYDTIRYDTIRYDTIR